MKKFLILAFSILFLNVYPVFGYSKEDVTKHNIETDCWVIYDGSIYDLTDYLSSHDRYLNIRDWCGMDITKSFETKNGIGRDHKPSSYYLLESYKIGTIEGESTSESSVVQENVVEEKEVEKSIPYNIVIPLFLSALLYWTFYILVTKKKLGKINIIKFNAFWNTVLILLFLIPSFGFGIFMILRYRFPSLYNSPLDVMYWHVELSVVVGVIAISHFLQRFGMYMKQIK
jgi:cytochrome b involved in lipid metabolism